MREDSSPHPIEPPPSTRRSFVPPPVERPTLVKAQLGAFSSFLEHLGDAATMVAGAVRALFRRPLEGREIVKQMEALGVASMGIVIVTSVFIGMVMSTQFAFGL